MSDDESLRLISYTTERGRGGATNHILVFKPAEHIELSQLQTAVQRSVLYSEGLVLSYAGTEEGYMKLVLTNLELARQLLARTGELPSMRECIQTI